MEFLFRFFFERNATGGEPRYCVRVCLACGDTHLAMFISKNMWNALTHTGPMQGPWIKRLSTGQARIITLFLYLVAVYRSDEHVYDV